MKKQIAFFALIILFLSSSCKKENGDKWNLNIFTIEDDMMLGQETALEIESNKIEYPILNPNQYPNAYKNLNRIRDSILASGKVNYSTEFPWQVKIINKDVLNAFALPGGYMYFYTGLIKFLDNEAQFAGVMAHEMAHIAHRHSTQQLTRVYGINLLLLAIWGNEPSLIAEITASLLSLAFSRAHENEADEYSVIYLYETSYDARGTAGFFSKMDDHFQSGFEVPFLSTHPSDDKRIERINAKWKSLGSKPGKLYDSSYQVFKNSLPN
jgi:beta-barrel assembly-enhancing protease